MATGADYLHTYYDSDQSKCWSCHPRPKTTQKLTSKFIHSLLRHPGDSYEWTHKQIKHLKSANLAKAVDPAKFLHVPPTMQQVTKNSVKKILHCSLLLRRPTHQNILQEFSDNFLSYLTKSTKCPVLHLLKFLLNIPVSASYLLTLELHLTPPKIS